jgi:hypothetical protein
VFCEQVGSLWNANLLQKLSKAKQDWDKMRGNAPTSRALLTCVQHRRLCAGWHSRISYRLADFYFVMVH